MLLYNFVSYLVTESSELFLWIYKYLCSKLNLLWNIPVNLFYHAKVDMLVINFLNII